MKRHATAQWQGTGKEGKGQITTESKVMDNVPYNYKMRFEDTPGTNPEELIAAAHSGCFTMKTSFLLNAAGFTADNIETKCYIDFADGAVKQSHLVVKASIPGIDKAKFEEIIQDAGKNCPISKLLNTEIKVEGSLV